MFKKIHKYDDGKKLEDEPNQIRNEFMRFV